MVKKQTMGSAEKASSPARHIPAPRRLEPAELQAIIGGRAHIITGGKDGEDDGIE